MTEIESRKKIVSFTDLLTWQKGHELVLRIYKITRSFPREELIGLTSQLRRAAVSFTSNIAEGFGRKSYKEKIKFYTIASGSLTEIKNQFLIARDVGYLKEDDFEKCDKLTRESGKLMTGLIRKSREFF